MKLAAVSYTNATPLLHGLPPPVWRATPREIAENPHQWDVGLLSVTSLFEHPDWQALPGVAIGSNGPAHTVKVIIDKSNLTIYNIKKFFVDPESNTAAILLKVLLRFYWKRDLSDILWLTHEKKGGEIHGAEARLLIGDKVFKEKSPGMDLGEIWTGWTGLPFVYACWIAQNQKAYDWGLEHLLPQAHYNLEHLTELASLQNPQDSKRLENYWKSLCYHWGEEQSKGLALFKKYYQELKRIYEA